MKVVNVYRNVMRFIKKDLDDLITTGIFDPCWVQNIQTQKQ